MKILIDATVYLCRQELAFRGQDESISSENKGKVKINYKMKIDSW